MEDSTNKEKLLKKIRNALINTTIETKDYAVDFDSAIQTETDDSLEIQFAKSFTQSGGKFVFCIDENEFLENLVQGAISDSLSISSWIAPSTLRAAAISRVIDCELPTVLEIRIVLVVDCASEVTSHNLRFCE